MRYALLALALLGCAARAPEPPPVARVVVLRHAEKQTNAGDDPPLSDVGRAHAQALVTALAGYKVTALYATHFKRTQETLAPLAKKSRKSITVLNADDVRGLITELKATKLGDTTVVAGHSDTVPDIVQGLGSPEKITLSDQDFGDLFIVERGRDGTVQLTRGKF